MPPESLVSGWRKRAQWVTASTQVVAHWCPPWPRKVTLLEAPAGFGKTTLLAQWRELLLAADMRVAWLTLDADDTGERLALYVAFALQEAGIDMTETGLLRDDHRGSPTGTLALHSVLQAIAGDGRADCLILDDVERVTSSDAQAQLDTLIRYAPNNPNIALGARSNPGLPLAHLTLMGPVNHFEADSLRFTPHRDEHLSARHSVSTRHAQGRGADGRVAWGLANSARHCGAGAAGWPLRVA